MQKSPSSDDLTPDLDEILQLDKSTLVEALRSMKSAESLASLRRLVGNLKEELATETSQLRRASSEDVEFATGHLTEELDQIAASLTLERAFYYVDRLV